MRLRKKPWVKEKILEYRELAMADGRECRGAWRQVFGNDNPIHIELGTGKGNFITGMARLHPEINYIGFDVVPDVLFYAIRKAAELELPNVRFVTHDIAQIEEFFVLGEVDRIYLNFSDPWPKNRHAKRRLTHENFLNKYKRLLVPGAEIHFKTDNRDLFEFSLNQLSAHWGMLKNISLDLHRSDFEGNVMTEYEAKFSGLGQPIYRCEAVLDERKSQPTEAEKDQPKL